MLHVEEIEHFVLGEADDGEDDFLGGVFGEGEEVVDGGVEEVLDEMLFAFAM